MGASKLIAIATGSRQDYAKFDPEHALLSHEHESTRTLEDICRALTNRGWEPVIVGHGLDLMKSADAKRARLVLNLSEGYGLSRNRALLEAAILEKMGVPVSGSDALTMGLTLDKVMTNLVLKGAGVPVPTQIYPIEPTLVATNVILKPRHSGSSLGIPEEPVNLPSAEIDLIRTTLGQDVLAEEFLSGPEFTVGIVGNGAHPRLVCGIEIIPQGGEQTFIQSRRVKNEWGLRVAVRPLRESDAEDAAVLSMAAKAFAALDCLDYARIDLRLGADGVPRVLDVNTIPGLSPRSGQLPIAAKMAADIAYEDLVNLLVTEALNRLER